MTDYVVTTRNKNGSLEERAYVAVDRTDLFKKLSEEGVTAVRVREGSVRKSTHNGHRLAPSYKRYGYIAASLIVVLIFSFVCLILPKEGQKSTSEKKEKKTILQEDKRVSVSNNVEEMGSRVNREKVRREVESVNNGNKNTVIVEEQQKTNDVYVVPVSTNRIFKTGTEQVLSMIFSTELGSMPPPLPRLHPNEVQNMPVILAKVSEILESDDDLVKDKKDIVNFAKKELREFIKQGGNHEEFLSYYRGELLKAYRQRRDSQRALDQFCDEPEADAATAREFCRRINEKLAENGIRGVELPDEFKEKTQE